MTINGFHDQPLNLIQLDHGRVFRYSDADCQRTHDVPPLSASLGTWVCQALICTKVTVTQLHTQKERCRKLIGCKNLNKLVRVQ